MTKGTKVRIPVFDSWQEPFLITSLAVLSYSGSYFITGIPCTIEVLEVDMDLLKSTAEGLTWPTGVPRPEGVMIWYVLTNSAELSS